MSLARPSNRPPTHLGWRPGYLSPHQQLPPRQAARQSCGWRQDSHAALKTSSKCGGISPGPNMPLAAQPATQPPTNTGASARAKKQQGGPSQTAEVWALQGLASARIDELSSASFSAPGSTQCPSVSPQSQGQLWARASRALSMRPLTPEAPRRMERPCCCQSAGFFYPQSPTFASVSRENPPHCTHLNM